MRREFPGRRRWWNMTFLKKKWRLWCHLLLNILNAKGDYEVVRGLIMLRLGFLKWM